MKGEEFSPDIPGYQCHHFVGHINNGRRSWGGILVCISKEICHLVNLTHENSLAWIHINNNQPHNNNSIHIGGVYMPTEASPYFNYNIDNFEYLEETVLSLSKTGHVILCGDLNARTADLVDFVPNGSVIGDIMPEILVDESYRSNVDTVVNSHGKRLLEFCKTTGIQIQNGRKTLSKFTCYRHNGESVVDYLLASASTATKISNFQILDLDPSSDHCAISFEIVYQNQNNIATYDRIPVPPSYKWDSSKKLDYQQKLFDEVSVTGLSNILCDITSNEQDIDSYISNLNRCIMNAASKTLRKSKSFKGNFPCNVWFDAECKQQKAALRNQAQRMTTADDRLKYH